MIKQEKGKVILEREAEAIVADIRSNLVASGANATGKTSASLEQITTDTRLIILGGKAFGLNRRSRGFVEGGRAAGGLPPFTAIQEWAQARGIITGSGKDATKIVNGIRWGIARKGTVLFQGDQTREIYTEVITENRTQEIIAQLRDVYIQDVASEIVLAFK